MTTSHTLTGDFASILGGSVRPPSVFATIGTNLGSVALVDLDNNEVRLPGTVRLTLDADLTFSLDLLATNSTGMNVTDGTLRYIVRAQYEDANRQMQTWSSGYFELTADADLSDKAGGAGSLDVTVAPSPALIDAPTAANVNDTDSETRTALNTLIASVTARVFPLDPTFASTDAAPTNATTHIQSVFDACAAAGGGIVQIPALPTGNAFFHTYNELGDNTLLVGDGRSSVLKQMPGLTYNSGGGAGGITGSYGLSCKTALGAIGFYNFTYDGNIDASADAVGDFDSAFDEADEFDVGLLKVANIAVDRLNRGTPSDGTWISPDYVFIDQVWSVDATRSNFLFQMGTNRATPGVLQAGRLFARNSAIDHLFYADNGEHVQVASFVGEGYWSEGAIATSGAKFASVALRSLEANPFNNLARAHDFQSVYGIDDRSGDRNGVITALSLKGDLGLLGGTDDTRCLIRSRGFGCSVENVQIEHTGTDVDMAFRIMVTESGASGGGTIEGPSMTKVKARSMPSRTRIFSHDPNAWGAALIGGHVSDVHMTIAAGAAVQATPLFDFRGPSADGFTARDVYVDTEDFLTAGPSAIYENATTTRFAEPLFEHVILRRAGAQPPWIDAGTTSSLITLRDCHTYGAAPARAILAKVEAIHGSTFGTTKVPNNWHELFRKTADQSVTSSTTLVSDTHLFTYLRANTAYAVEVNALVDASDAGDFKYSFSGPAGSTVVKSMVAPALAIAAGTAGDAQWSGDTGGGLGAGALFPARVTATVVTGATEGFFTFTWAQQTSSATPTIVKSGSYMSVRRIS